MIKNMTRNRLGTLRCAPSAHPASGAFAAFGGGTGVSLPKCETQRLMLVGRLGVVATAPQTYIDDVVRPSAALQERSP
jgi:hypothetical protein